jgi:hypothetical protein
MVGIKNLMELIILDLMGFQVVLGLIGIMMKDYIIHLTHHQTQLFIMLIFLECGGFLQMIIFS